MSEREIKLSYIAGLIDGEGCIGMYLNSHNGNYQLRLSIEMTIKSGLDLVYEVFGGKWYYRPPCVPTREKYTIMLFNKEAFFALKELEKYLIVKKEHAKIIQEADWVSFKNKKMTDEQQLIRVSVSNRIKELNTRGYYGENTKSERKSWSKK